MTSEKFEEYLKSIGGLKNGYYIDREPITERYFFSVGDGWLRLIKFIIEESIKLGWDKQICQVKEKFGGLRFYINGAPKEVQQLITDCEDMSYHICEECGATENIGRTSGWISTLCEDCAKDSDKPWKMLENKFDKMDNDEFKIMFNGNT